MVKLTLHCVICGREEEFRGLWFSDVDRKALSQGWDVQKDEEEICGACRKAPIRKQRKPKNS